jgi:serine/threonine protein kinase
VIAPLRSRGRSAPVFGSTIDADLRGLFRSDARWEIDPLLSDATLPAALFASAPRPSKGASPSKHALAARDRSVALEAARPLPRGAIVDKYRLEDVLGVGGFAVVYRATHLLLRVPVALKLLRPDVIRRRPGIADLLLEEARYAARIHHDNVVRIIDVTHSRAISYIVMEYIDGETLATAIDRRGALPWQEVLRIGIGVASGLRAGLEDGLVHRDIKPANLLLPRKGHVKIVDFGLARALADPRAEDTQRLVGTRGYIAPEIALGREADFRADVFALGVSLHEALGGRRWSRREQPVARGAPAGLLQVLDSMVAENPTRRPSSYDALLATFHAAFR